MNKYKNSYLNQRDGSKAFQREGPSGGKGSSLGYSGPYSRKLKKIERSNALVYVHAKRNASFI